MGHININLFGRFGNQMFQYAFARAYAKATKSVLHTNSWVGQKIFGLKDEPIKHPLRRMALDIIPSGEIDIELFGYFQNSESLKYMNKKELQSWFRLDPQFHKYIVQYEQTAHLRYGDYLNLQHIYCIVEKQSYLNAFKKYGFIENNMMWISEDTVKPNELPQDFKFVPDFISLMYSRNIFRANSSFSWWAATLSNARVYSPVVENKVGKNVVDFVEGNWPRLIDQSHVDGGAKISDLYVL